MSVCWSISARAEHALHRAHQAAVGAVDVGGDGGAAVQLAAASCRSLALGDVEHRRRHRAPRSPCCELERHERHAGAGRARRRPSWRCRSRSRSTWASGIVAAAAAQVGGKGRDSRAPAAAVSRRDAGAILCGRLVPHPRRLPWNSSRFASLVAAARCSSPAPPSPPTVVRRRQADKLDVGTCADRAEELGRRRSTS